MPTVPGPRDPVPSASVRLVLARCSVDYIGRLTAHLPMATRLLLVKADGSVSVHADDRAYKPLNWMSPPCKLEDELVAGPPRVPHRDRPGGPALSRRQRDDRCRRDQAARRDRRRGATDPLPRA